jgi:hypothetical protein
MSKMVPEIKAQWLEALRGGNYQQGKKVLRHGIDGEDRFCCLGVLCDIIEPELWSKSDPALGSNDRYVLHRGAQGLPAMTIRTAASLDVDACMALARLNDSGKTFAEIADVIERDL